MSAQAQYDIRSARVKTSYAKVIPHFCNKGQICSVLLLWSEISIQTDVAFRSTSLKKKRNSFTSMVANSYTGTA